MDSWYWCKCPHRPWRQLTIKIYKHPLTSKYSTIFVGDADLILLIKKMIMILDVTLFIEAYNNHLTYIMPFSILRWDHLARRKHQNNINSRENICLTMDSHCRKPITFNCRKQSPESHYLASLWLFTLDLPFSSDSETAFNAYIIL